MEDGVILTRAQHVQRKRLGIAIQKASVKMQMQTGAQMSLVHGAINIHVLYAVKNKFGSVLVKQTARK